MVIRIGEPTPSHGGDVPDTVLDELRNAFTGTPTGSARPRHHLDDHLDDQLDEFGVDPTIDPTFDGLLDLTLDDLPRADLDDLPGSTPDALSPADISPADIPPADIPPASIPPTSIPPTSTPLDDSTELWTIAIPATDRAGSDSAEARSAPSAPISPSPEPGRASRGSTGSARRPTIVIGGDDSLPDAIYLDDDGADAPNGRLDTEAVRNDRGLIVIGDELEASGAFDAVPVPSRSMDPRVRARRIAVKRAQGRKRLLWVASVAGVVVVVVGVLAVFSSSLFAVDRVDVQGAPYTQARYGDRLQVLIDEMMGEPVLLVDTKDIEERLEQFPWIERAFVTTDFPHRVLIDVRERQPLATFVGSDSRYRVIDRDGFVLDTLVGRPAGYMLIEGIGPDLEAGSAAGAQYGAAAQLVGALPAEIRSITTAATLDPSTGDLGLVIQRIPVVDPGDPTALPASQEPREPASVEVRIGSFNGLDGKLARLLQLVRDGLDDSARIDVSTDDVIG